MIFTKYEGEKTEYPMIRYKKPRPSIYFLVHTRTLLFHMYYLYGETCKSAQLILQM